MPKKAKKKPKSKTKSTQPRRPAGDAIAIAMIVFGLFLITSIVSYNNQDPPNGSALEYKNMLGPVGAYISYFLITFSFGRVFTLLFPVVIILWAIDILRKKGYGLTLKFSGVALPVVILACSLWALFRSIAHLPQSTDWTGFIGDGINSLLIKYTSVAGSAIILFGLTLIYLTIMFRINWAILGVPFRAIAEKIKENREMKRQEESKPAVSSKSKKDLNKPEKTKKPAIKSADESESKTKPHPPEIVRGEKKPKPVQPASSAGTEEVPEFDPNTSPVYQLPESELLIEQDTDDLSGEVDEETLHEQSNLIEEKFKEFGVDVQIVEIHPGPVVTRYDLKPAPGVKVGKIVALQDDLALSLSAPAVRILAPIPGAGAVGIEVPNPATRIVRIREIVDSTRFQETNAALPIAWGKTAQGEDFVTDLATLPHVLVAGTTGSGKSVCINTIITSLLLKKKPDELMFAMVDPKKLELSIYSELRKHHLLFLEETDEVIATEPKNAVLLLQSLVHEMEQRYTKLAEVGVRKLTEYNDAVEEGRIQPDEDGKQPIRLPYIVAIIDELADLMMTASKDVEEPIARLAQMARAVGIHLVVATQRPSVDVITGVIKANFPGRIGFMVASKIDSRTILDRPGAETLLGKGDSLYLSSASPHPVRVHGAFVSTGEVHKLIGHVVRQPAYVKPTKLVLPSSGGGGGAAGEDDIDERDKLFPDAVKLVLRHKQGSVSLLQRRLKIGYSRAGRLLDQLEQAGIVGPFEGSKAREVLISDEDAEQFLS